MEPPDEDPIDVASRFGIQPLLPDDFGDEALAGMKVLQLKIVGNKFGEEFGKRYGQPTPAFFPDSLEGALAEVCYEIYLKTFSSTLPSGL